MLTQLPPLEAPDTQDLVHRAQQGEQLALAVLYETYFERIYRYCLARLGNVAEAEDLTAEVFVRMLRSITTFQWRAQGFNAWLFRIAHNQVIDHLRQQNAQKTYLSAVAGTLIDDSCEKRLNGKWDREELGQAIDRLTPAQRNVITLRFAAGLSIAETASVLDKEIGNVKVLQHNAVIALRRMLLALQTRQPGRPRRRIARSTTAEVAG